MTRLRAAVAAVPLVVLSACTAQAESPPPGPPATATPAAAPTATAQGGGVFFAFLEEPSAIDPGRAFDSQDLTVVDRVFDSLTATDARLRIVPGAAEVWESNPEATVWTFHLRAGATFHDGEPVTAESFKRAWQRTIAEASSAGYFLLSPIVGFEQARAGGDLSGVRVVDPHTLQVELDAPFADLPPVLSHPALGPVPAAALEEPETFARRPIGNGPFAMAEPWQPGNYIRLEAFPGHHRDPHLDEIRFRIYTGDDAVADGYEDFAAGNLDLAPVPDGELAAAIERFGRAEGGYRGPGVIDGIKLVTAFYGFDTTTPPFDDPAVRRALALLIDRERMRSRFAGDSRTVADTVVPPGITGYRPGDCAFCAFDPDRAQELLGGRELGPIELVHDGGVEHERIAEQVQRDVNAALGAGTLRLRSLPRDEWLEAVRGGDASFFLSGWLAEYPAADSFLYPLFHASRAGSDNITRYRDPQVTELLDTARRTLDPAARSELYRQVESVVLSEMPIVPLFHYGHSSVVADRVSGLVMSPMGYVDMTEVRVRPGN